ncbi:envelope stress response protein PspG [Sodalis sp. C49]|uniref:envelope stress response protein PspG n=1 Tax=unclassified Sodalis (in: enterobacteria) TaxID=2636512 RepID=UPI003965A9A3
MVEFVFVIAFFFMLLLTGISFLGVLAALAVGFLVMMFAGVLVMALKLLPWLLLALVVAWIWRTVNPPRFPRY